MDKVNCTAMLNEWCMAVSLLNFIDYLRKYNTVILRTCVKGKAKIVYVRHLNILGVNFAFYKISVTYER